MINLAIKKLEKTKELNFIIKLYMRVRTILKL